MKAFKAQHGSDRGYRGEDEGEGAVRLRVPDEGATVVHDVIRGDTTFQHVHLDDPVIARADGSVLYNFAVAIDDLDAEITHVVRGEDHLSNTPKQPLVLEALGVEPPLYAHLPLLHGPDGKKLSKRHGAASVQELRDAGYVPARCATTSRCWAGAPPTTRRSCRPSSSSSSSTSPASSATRRASTSRSCAGSTAATCASCRSTS